MAEKMSEEGNNTFFKWQDSQNHVSFRLEKHDYYAEIVSNLFLFTGLGNALFCNSFINESVRLIMNSVSLFENGYFDCAFYSLRQSVEIMNCMLVCSTDEAKYQSWHEKAWFPVDGKIKILLSQSNSNYSEIKTAVPEFFDRFEDLLKQVNKIVHKQGFGSFYSFVDIHGNPETKRKEREELFVSFLNHCIGMVLLIYIALDPISLILTDDAVISHIPFDFVTEPVPISFFEEVFSPDYIDQIKNTQFYICLKEYFLSLEELKPATYSLIHCQHYDIEHLSDIRSQVYMISPLEQRILTILENGINASRFYSNDCLIGYFTSIRSNAWSMGFSSDQFDQYLNRPYETNIAWHNVFISLFHCPEGYLIIEHNEQFSRNELKIIVECLGNESDDYR